MPHHEDVDMSIGREYRWCRTGGRRNPVATSAWVIAALVIGTGAAFPENGGSPLRRIDRDELCVTNGVVSEKQGGELAIDTPSSRAVVRNVERSEDQVAEIHFRYLGPSETDKPLASGELRRQIGLKLQAEDTCNLVYAMWHIAPDARIVVSVKRNAAMHTHAQCGARGYAFITPQSRIDPAPILPGEVNTLRADLHGTDLAVTANGKLAWRGRLGSALPSGPMGFRTDNVQVILDYNVGAAGTSRGPKHQGRPVSDRCGQSEGD
jgi:hypothetical protein